MFRIVFQTTIRFIFSLHLGYYRFIRNVNLQFSKPNILVFITWRCIFSLGSIRRNCRKIYIYKFGQDRHFYFYLKVQFDSIIVYIKRIKIIKKIVVSLVYFRVKMCIQMKLTLKIFNLKNWSTERKVPYKYVKFHINIMLFMKYHELYYINQLLLF